MAATFDGAALQNVIATGGDFTAASFIGGVAMNGVTFIGAVLAGANLTGARLARARPGVRRDRRRDRLRCSAGGAAGQ